MLTRARCSICGDRDQFRDRDGKLMPHTRWEIGDVGSKQRLVICEGSDWSRR